ncbi:MAG: GNAT family N-acetyltransferase [Anaerolineae bacterium]|nr:GNAT family N-acetyltransferase [Anaerolineae bacterium]
MNGIESRPYQDDDLPLLQDAFAGWIQKAGICGYYTVGHLAHWIYEVLRGRHPVADLVRVWEDEAAIIGIEINLLFETAFYVFISLAYRGTDVEIEMLQSAFETTCRLTHEKKQDNSAVFTDVFSCDAIRIDLLAQLGFEQHRLWDHVAECDLSEPIPQVHLPDGFSIRPATTDDYTQLALARNDIFDTDWTPEMYRDQVMQKPGYQPEREIVVVAPNEQIMALTIIRLDQVNKIGLFEPVGTRHAFRRRGLAQAMMTHGLHEMKNLGMETAIVEYEAANLAASELYRRLGFRKKYETWGYKCDCQRGITR